MRPLHGLGIAERPGQMVVVAVEVERFVLRPQTASGETRSALTLEQILDLVAAIAKIPGDTSYRGPILQAALDSLRPIKDVNP